ncbi:hypothetical protein BKA70DRAFT_1435494 [Coprinopsis sp. MPI-PUGE-AT-0042]|nr:hypothetical protein BKA70DRAFT_1435494 [Coprinopsis sp. MPI-PUGE-AT-0042]
MQDPLDLFTSIRIHGLALDGNGGSAPLTLDRSVSFPSPTWTRGVPGDAFFHDLSSRIPPTTGYTLEARISPKSNVVWTTGRRQDGILGEGRSSFVYALEIIDIHPSSPTSIQRPPLSLESLPRLCIKAAQPAYSRSLAREAWFYERLDKAGLTSVVVPRCYGLFSGGAL